MHPARPTLRLAAVVPLLAIGLACDPSDVLPSDLSEPQPPSFDVPIEWSRPHYVRSLDVPDANDGALLADRVRRVRLDACGPDGSSTPTRVVWTMAAREGDAVGEPFPLLGVDGTEVPESCAVEWQAPWEGAFRVEVEVTIDGQTERGRLDLEVDDIWIAALGDSYASGEGNPHANGAWKQARCHRSANGWPALIAERVQGAHPGKQVLLTHLACSGGSIENGVLNGYGGIQGDISTTALDPQASVLRDLVASTSSSDHPVTYDWLARERRPDAIVFTAGGNDIDFGPLVEDALWFGLGDDVVASIPGRLETLDGRLDAFDTRLDDDLLRPYAWYDGLPDADDAYSGGIFHLEYPDPTQDGPGNYQACWTDNSFFMSDADMREIHEELMQPLNALIHAHGAAAGWTTVDGIDEVFAYHGVCAADPWFIFPGESQITQGDILGTYHPRFAGHEAMAEAAWPAISGWLAGRDESRLSPTVWARLDSAPLGTLTPGTRIEQLDRIEIDAPLGMLTAMTLGGQPLGPGAPIQTEPGPTELVIERYWSGWRQQGIPIRLPDVVVPVEVVPAIDQVLDALIIEVETVGGQRVAVPTVRPGFGDAGTWIDPVTVHVTHPDPAYTVTLTEDWLTGDAPYTGAPLVTQSDRLNERRIRIDVAGPTPSLGSVEIRLVDLETDLERYAIDTLTVTDAGDPSRVVVYASQNDVPVEVSGMEHQDFLGADIAITPGDPTLTEGFVLRVDGVLTPVTATLPIDAVQVEVIACTNFLSDCDADPAFLHPNGHEVVFAFNVP
jgi:hypothetical protein